MRHISKTYERLMLAAIANGRAGTRAFEERAKPAGTGKAAKGLASATNEREEVDPRAALASAGEVQPMGIREKDGAGKPRQFNRGDNDRVRNHSANRNHLVLVVDHMPTRQGRAQSRPSLLCIEGGRA